MIESLGVVSHVWVHHPTGRREGVSQLMLESRGSRADARDRGVILDVLRTTDWELRYEWAAKSEPLLWIADALGGAVREHLMNTDQSWFDRLRSVGAIPDPLIYRSGL